MRYGTVWGQVEWTEWAVEHIRQREYSYISPTFLRGKEGHIKLIVRAALTNSPALNMQALAKTEDDFMKQDLIDKILAKLGLKADAATCEECASTVKVIDSIEDPARIKQTLAHLQRKAEVKEFNRLPESGTPAQIGLFG